MVIVGEVGSGPKKEETESNTVSMRRKGGGEENGERWACRELVQGCAGEGGTAVRGCGSEWLFRTR